MVLTRSGKGTQKAQGPSAEETPSIKSLPHKVLLHVLSYVDQPADLRSFFHAAIVSKGLPQAAADPILAASLLMKTSVWNSDHYDKLESAASRGRGDVMLELLKMGVSATWRPHEVFCKWETPLQLAVRFNLPQVAQYLWQREDVRADLEAAADALHDAAHRGHASFVQLLLTPPSPLHAMSIRPGSSLSPLQEAAWSAHVETVQFLLSRGASCAHHNEYGENALHSACSQRAPCMKYHPGSEDVERSQILSMLLDTPEGKMVMDSQNDRRWTPLAYAAMNKLAGCYEVLLRASSRAVNVRNHAFKTPLQIARDRRSWHPPVLEVLVQYGADPKA